MYFYANTNHLKKTQLATALKIISFIFYAWNDALCKKLTTGSIAPLATHTVIFYQYALAACIIAPFYLYQKDSTKHIVGIPYHLLRTLLCTTGIILLNQSFTIMPLSYAVSFNLLSPLITVIWASIWFKESMSHQKIFALTLSIVAYFVLLDSSKYSTSTLSIQSCLKPTIALLCFQANTVITKKLTQLKETNSHLTLFLFISIPLLLMPFELQGISQLSWQQSLTILHMAINGAIATLALHQAIAFAELTFLLPFGFLKYSIISFFGYLYFFETPNTYHLIGILLTISAIYHLNRAEKKKYPGPSVDNIPPKKLA